jgi:hypothetical protein
MMDIWLDMRNGNNESNVFYTDASIKDNKGGIGWIKKFWKYESN